MKIKVSSYCSMFSFLMISCFLGISGTIFVRISKVDFWMVPIISTIIGIPILYLFIYLLNFKKDLNINDLNRTLFGKKIGNIMNFIILIGIISFNLITFWNLTKFVSSQYLYNTPQWYVTILFIFAMIYCLNKGRNCILRSSLILFYISLILYVICTVGLGLQVKISNIKPILENGIIPVLKSIYNYICYIIFPIFILLIIPKDKIESKNLNKSIIKTYFLTNLAIFIVMFIIISVFGIDLTLLYQYPSYHILKRVFIGGFIERMENTLSVQWILNIFVPCLFSYYFTFYSIKDIFKIKKDYFIYPFLIMLMFISQEIFKNNTVGEDFLLKFYPIIFGLLTFGIIFITFIKAKKKDS